MLQCGTRSAAYEENLVLRPGVQLQASVMNPRGNGARDIQVLRNERVLDLHRRPLEEFERYHTYDTYDGGNQAGGPDWYALAFPAPVACNCIEMTMGFPNHNGGWWRSLDVEVQHAKGDPWQPVTNLQITPAYNFADSHAGRLPYETYALTFETGTVHALRLVGRPGGSAEFTSLARLAAYCRDLTRWNPIDLPAPPIPYTFQLIEPHIIHDLSESFAALTGLPLDFPLFEFYLDHERFVQYYASRDRTLDGATHLWGLVGELIGWDVWDHYDDERAAREVPPLQPYVRVSFHNVRGSAVAPLAIDGQLLGELATHFALLDDTFDIGWHRRYAARHGFLWQEYEPALLRTPRMTMRQLEGAAAMLGVFANQIARLAHRNLLLQQQLDDVRRQRRSRSQSPKELVKAAIDCMQQNLEEEIGVAEVAQALAVSPTYLGVIFKQHTGRSPSDYLIDLRLARAKEYLEHTHMSVMDVCVALGYTPSYFSRLFKRHTGQSPSEYKRSSSKLLTT
jgi:AraC-like DNA-binding protein